MDYVTKNKLALEAERLNIWHRFLIFNIGTAIAITSYVFLHYIAALYVALFAFVLFIFYEGNKILQAGAKGEDLAIDLLKKLPNNYTIFNQIDIPNQQSSTGFNEADIVISGPNAIFLIEVKHNNSHITGTESSPKWEIRKKGRGGTIYSDTMRNPVAQVKRLVWLLSDELKKRKASTWIQVLVLFTNDKASLDIRNGDSIPVLRNKELLGYIVNYEGKGKEVGIKKAHAELVKLKTRHRAKESA